MTSDLMEPTVLSVEESLELLRSEQVALYDVRPAPRYALGHLPGAIHLDPGRYKREQLPSELDSPLLFYCLDASCGASRTAAKRAAAMGFTKVFILDGGIRNWMDAGQPMVN